MNSRVALIAASVSALLLAGCKGSVTVDMASDAPADPQVADVRVELAGLEFERSDGQTEKLEFTAPEAANLTQLASLQNSVRLFTSEELPEGTYTGVRLLFATEQDASVTLQDGRQYDLTIAEGEYAPVDFTVEEDKTSNEALSLSLDLRKSLVFSDAQDQYTLTPALRSAITDEAAQLTGLVSASCPAGSSLTDGGAVYLFQGEDVDVDDMGSSVTPYATSGVFTSSFNGQLSYALRFLPAGDYTIALTCEGDEDEPSVDNEIVFEASATVRLDETESATHNFAD
jgi:hypothetical protein